MAITERKVEPKNFSLKRFLRITLVFQLMRNDHYTKVTKIHKRKKLRISWRYYASLRVRQSGLIQYEDPNKGHITYSVY